MKEYRTNNIKRVLRISYFLLMLFFLLTSIYFIFGSAYASAYGNGEISWVGLIWSWKGIVATFIFSTIAFIGLKKPKKLGVIFSYSISIGMGIYFLIALINSTLYEFDHNVKVNFEYILGIIFGVILIVGIPWFLILCTRKLELATVRLSKIDYGITCGLTLILILSWYIMFKF